VGAGPFGQSNTCTSTNCPPDSAVSNSAYFTAFKDAGEKSTGQTMA